MRHAGGEGSLQQRTGVGGIVQVVLQRVRHRLRDDGMGGKMHHGIDVVRGEQPVEQGGIAGVADDQLAVQHRGFETGAQVVQCDHTFAGFAELAYDMAADVTGTAGNQDVCFTHPPILASRS